MHDLAMRRRIAALVIAALLAMSGAALATVVLASDDQTAVNSGGLTGNYNGGFAVRGGDDELAANTIVGSSASDYLAFARDGDNRDT